MRTSFFITILASCSGPESSLDPDEAYDAAREACGLHDGEVVALPYGPTRNYEEITQPCAESVGKIFKLDWASFDEMPRAFSQPSSVAQAVVGGGYEVLAADWGSLDDLPSLLGSNNSLAATSSSWPYESQTAGVFLLEWLTRFQSEIVWGGEKEGAAMSFSDDVIQVHDLLANEGILADSSHPVVVAALLAHEVAHIAGAEHVACDSGEMQCDVDDGGAFGAELGVLWLWYVRFGAEVAHDDCSTVAFRILYDCSYLLDAASSPICADLANSEPCDQSL